MSTAHDTDASARRAAAGMVLPSEGVGHTAPVRPFAAGENGLGSRRVLRMLVVALGRLMPVAAVQR